MFLTTRAISTVAHDAMLLARSAAMLAERVHLTGRALQAISAQHRITVTAFTTIANVARAASAMPRFAIRKPEGGRSVRYSEAELDAWVANRVRETADESSQPVAA